MSDNNSFRIGNSSKFLNSAVQAIQKPLERLGSGRRINQASDDAAGLAVADSLAATVLLNSRASKNTGDAQSALAISDGATQGLADITTRLQELATQSANGTLSDQQRGALSNEFQSLSEEFNRIVQTTEFNGEKLLQGGSKSIQVGTGSDPNSQLQVPQSQAGDQANTVNTLDISSIDQARSAIDNLSQVSQRLSSDRADIGAAQSRIDSANSNAISSRDNAAAAESRIRDADVAEESANFVSKKILIDVNAALGAAGPKLTAKLVQSLLG